MTSAIYYLKVIIISCKNSKIISYFFSNIHQNKYCFKIIKKTVNFKLKIIYTYTLYNKKQNNITHGNIKPSNIFITEDGYAKLADTSLYK